MMENKYLAVDDYMLNKASYKIKNLLGIWKFDDAEVLIDMDYKLLNYIFLKNIATSLTCLIEDDGKFYSRIFLQEAFFVK